MYGTDALGDRGSVLFGGKKCGAENETDVYGREKRSGIGEEKENECSDTLWSRKPGRGAGGTAFDQRDSCGSGIRNI